MRHGSGEKRGHAYLRGLGARRAIPVDTSERRTHLSTTTTHRTAIVIVIVIVIVIAVTIIGFYLLAGYIVQKTGATTGIADIGRAVADIISAITHRS